MPVRETTNADTTSSIVPSYPQLLSAVSGWFRSRGVPAEEAKDLGQDTIVRTLVHLKRHGQRGDDLKPLVFTIARNLFTERARRGAGMVVALTDEMDVPDPSPTPLDTVMQHEESTAVAGALASLGSRHRRVIELWMHGETPADIARTFGIKRNAADALLHRARRRLASALRESGEAFGSFLGLLGLRARLTLQRIAFGLSRFDPTALFAQAVGAVAVVGIAGVLASGGGAVAATAQAHLPSPSITHASRARASGDVTSHAPVGSAVSHAPTPPGVYANLADQRAGAHAAVPDPSTGRATPVGIEIWHKPGTAEGHTEAVLDAGAAALCAHGCPTIGGGK